MDAETINEPIMSLEGTDAAAADDDDGAVAYDAYREVLDVTCVDPCV